MRRRDFLATSGAVVALAAAERDARAAKERATTTKADTEYRPVQVPNGATLKWTRATDGAKVFHLVAEEIEHTFMPGLQCTCWGYNGRTPGPLIEAVEGDLVRIYVTNLLPEATTVHWHGLPVPNGMDGVAGLTQEKIPPGATFRYEFVLPRAGTFMYHPHFDEMTQMAMGMMGMFVVHEKRPTTTVDRDYALMLSEWHIPAGARRPDPLAMSDFNVLTFNSTAFPATEPLVARTGDRVRIRLGNLSAMDHHPIHLHGPPFSLTSTDGGVVPASARQPETTVLVPVGSVRVVELTASMPGDWPLHCHMTHHVMNQMGHHVENNNGADVELVDARVRALVDGYMAMGQDGMGAMSMMSMPLPNNSVAMRGGRGPFGIIDMGGMFTVLKVRDVVDAATKDGWYAHPAGTVARAATADELAQDGVTPPAAPKKKAPSSGHHHGHGG